MPLPEKAEIRSCCFAPPADRDEQRESKYCGQTGQTDRRHDYKAVAPGFRIVVITIQKYPIDKLTDEGYRKLLRSVPVAGPYLYHSKYHPKYRTPFQRGVVTKAVNRTAVQ